MYINKGFYTIIVTKNGVAIGNRHTLQTMTNNGFSGWRNITISKTYYMDETRLARFVRNCDRRGVTVPAVLRKAVAANSGAVWDNRRAYWF